MPALKINNLSHSINNRKILKDINLKLEKDKIAWILGPSGCGKTTLLKVVAGLEKVNSGEIYLNNVEVSSKNKHTWPNDVITRGHEWEKNKHNHFSFLIYVTNCVSLSVGLFGWRSATTLSVS